MTTFTYEQWEGRGQVVAQAARTAGIKLLTLAQESGGLRPEHAKCLKDLEKPVAGLSLDKAMLEEMAKGTGKPRVSAECNDQAVAGFTGLRETGHFTRVCPYHYLKSTT